MMVMKSNKNKWEAKKDFQNYLDEINLDGWFFKLQLLVGGVVFLFLFIYLLLSR